MNDLPILNRSKLNQVVARSRDWLFYSTSDRWLSILRIGLGLQLLLHVFSLRSDWNYLLGGTGRGLVSRDLAEALLSLESPIIPRLGWVVLAGKHVGLSETAVLDLSWYALTVASTLLVSGLFCRPAAIASWFFYLCSVKSSGPVTYGVDAFTTAGLFYLLLSPLPDRLSIDYFWRAKLGKPEWLGFWRRVLQLHLCFTYFFSGLTKALGRDWWNGINLWRSLIRPPFDIIPADVLMRFKYFLPPAGVAVVLLEIAYAVCIWIPKLRRPWLIAMLLMHIGIGLIMGMYLFALIMIVLNLAAFGPGTLWQEKASVERLGTETEVSLA